MTLTFFWNRIGVAGALAAVLAFALLSGACAPSVAANTDDASITARVRTVLLNDTEIGARSIEVATSSGVVTISGVVRTPAEATRAVNLARQVEGVRDVQTSLQVAPSGG
jgi:hyperosmotically inducible protein